MDERTRGDIETVADWIVDAGSVCALTGAGISVESGIPDFRSKDGLWSRYDPVEYASIYNFLDDPAKVWNMFTEIIELCMKAEPNPAHLALTELEEMGRLDGIITQNVDYLHQRAGTKNVIEFHGNNNALRCQECGKMHSLDVRKEQMPPQCDCGGHLRPDVVLFDEGIPPEAMIRSRDLASGADLMLVIGTSAVVAPASYMPYMTKANDGRLVEFDIDVTQITHDVDLSIFGKAGTVLPEVVSAVRRKMKD